MHIAETNIYAIICGMYHWVQYIYFHLISPVVSLKIKLLCIQNLSTMSLYDAMYINNANNFFSGNNFFNQLFTMKKTCRFIA